MTGSAHGDRNGLTPEEAQAALDRLFSKLTLAFGFLLPMVCLVFDPLVFRVGGFGPMFPRLVTWGPVYCVTAMVALLLWTTTGRAPAWCAGALAFGAVFAAGVAVLLAPFTFLGLFAGIGLLGLVPFGTALVFGGHAWRAWRTAAATGRPAPARLVCAALGAVIVATPLLLPAACELELRRARRWLASEDTALHGAAARRIAWSSAIGCSDAVVVSWRRCKDPEASDRMAAIYLEVHGDPIGYRSADLFH